MTPGVSAANRSLIRDRAANQMPGSSSAAGIRGRDHGLLPGRFFTTMEKSIVLSIVSKRRECQQTPKIKETLV